MTQHRLTRPFPLTALTLAAFPLLLLVAFFGYVIEARLHLGHWPSYGQPDPKQLGWWIQHSILQLSFVGFPMVALIAAGLAVFGRVRSREFPFLTIIATIVVASAALIAFARIDPGGFVDWFWD
jgi:hypothetical protein